MVVVVHLKPEWYDKLLEDARPQSKVEACLKSAYAPPPNDPEGEYVLRCDDYTISLLAALADIACPAAIPALSKAYREAKRA
ncbi:MAG TPA: hypothetical protein VL754_12830 [Verrucomicrobiae bacterium]|nr:hypothetical protein [Verrucomicrobiae bacterium]